MRPLAWPLSFRLLPFRNLAFLNSPRVRWGGGPARIFPSEPAPIATRGRLGVGHFMPRAHLKAFCPSKTWWSVLLSLMVWAAQRRPIPPNLLLKIFESIRLTAMELLRPPPVYLLFWI